MSDILSPEELNALIDAFRDPSEAAVAAIPGVAHVSDPATEVWLNEAQISALNLIHGSFAWAAESALSDFLEPATTISLASQSQMTFEEFLPATEQSLVATIAAPPLKGRALLAVGFPLAQLILDSYFRRGALISNRTVFNEVELSVLRDAIEKILSGYAEAWKQLAKLKPSVKSIDNIPGGNLVALPADPVMVATLDVRIGTRKESICLCLPNEVLKPFLAGVATRSSAKSPKPETGFLELQTATPGIGRVDVPSIRGEGYQPGSVIQLGDTVEVFADDKQIGLGEFVVIDGGVALRILESYPKRRGSGKVSRPA